MRSASRAIDDALGGGFAVGALHEIAAARETETAAATGFALALTRARATKVCDATSDQPRGPQTAHARGAMACSGSPKISRSPRTASPYGPGLDEAGIAPEQLITVAAARARDVLWAMEEALRCRAIGVVIGEMRARAIDQVATRRLSLAAAAGNTLGLLSAHGAGR